MAVVATYNFDGCICRIDDSYIASRTPEQRKQDRKSFEELAQRLWTEQEMRRIQREKAATK